MFGSKQIRSFDIEANFSGLFSRALTSPCGRIQIPINQDRSKTDQIVEYLKRDNDEVIQHSAVGTEKFYAATDAIAERGARFMPKPRWPIARPQTPALWVIAESQEHMAPNGSLIDGKGALFASIEQDQIDRGVLAAK